ncbi:GtrA family protein [Streptomyces sp. NPDC005917]|uniref:GtrA family protein n=1 Tax=unclassified Streptomyces TaxID=2593676 RepID=UPI0033E4CCF7
MHRLPFGLARIVGPSLLGFVLINGFTFGIDLGLLTVFHSGLRWSLPLSITLAYLMAFGLSFVLNRELNFRSHAAIGRQTALYLVAIGVNYLVCILGIGAGLAALGVEYHVARVTAGMSEAVYMYSAMRWVVFRDVPHY